MNGPPWRPKGVRARGGCAPANRGKLKHKLILVFPKEPFKQHYAFQLTFCEFVGGGETLSARLHADRPPIWVTTTLS